LAAFGSQGQQRTAVLALKVAEYDVMRARTADAPILLLDDVLSELDAERAAGFLDAVGGYEQAFLTTTELPRAVGPASTWSIQAATVTRC
jgi:DNA replication and repair protein RecF